MLAMAHGSNEINVSAPLVAEMFMLNGNYTTIPKQQEYTAILIGLVSVILGTITLGVRYLDKYRSKFMKITLSNGFIANTIVSLVLFFASSLNYTVSCTYILAPCLLLLRKMD
jgi:phosphate/sulfate permease